MALLAFFSAAMEARPRDLPKIESRCTGHCPPQFWRCCSDAPSEVSKRRHFHGACSFASHAHIDQLQASEILDTPCGRTIWGAIGDAGKRNKNQNTGSLRPGETWSGRGRMPAQDAGEEIERYRI